MMQLPDNVKFIIETLMEHGYEAYAVGGCVRDAIMKRTPEDWDITTSAQPEQVKQLFRRTLDTGIQHGTVTIMIGKEGFEVTTYRIDGEYEDHRHPKNVEYTTSLIEDLKRRDFTINAMAFNPAEGLIDKFGGLEDIERKVIRCVGNPQDRFDEDALRMLRAVRFSGQLGFSIEEETKKAMISKSQTIENVSAERIRVEITKLLLSKGSGNIRFAYETGLTKVFLPEFDQMMETEQNNPHHCFSVGEHTLAAVQVINDKFLYLDSKLYTALCYTMFLHDIAKPLCKSTDENGIDHFYGHNVAGEKLSKEILRRLKFDNMTIDMVSRLIRWHDYRFTLTKKNMRKAASKVGRELMPYLFMVQEADTLSKSMFKREEKVESLERAKELFEEIERDGDALTIAELAINGKDLIEMGVKPGKNIGDTLSWLISKVLEHPEYNEKEKLLKMCENKIN